MTSAPAGPLEFGVSTHVLASIKPQEHFPLFAAHGFSLVELNLGYYPLLADERKFKELVGIIARSGIRIHSLHLPYGGTAPSLGNMDISHPDPQVRGGTLAAIRLGLERLASLGGRCLVIHPSVGRFDEPDLAERLALCLESVRACLEIIDDLPGASGIQVALEILPPRSVLHTAEEVDRFFERLGDAPVGLCLDVNHTNIDHDPVEFARLVGRRVITTHLSDNDGVQERHWLPGRGVIPWRELLRALVAAGYAGPLIYETSQEDGVGDEKTVAEHRRVSGELAAMLAAIARTPDCDGGPE